MTRADLKCLVCCCGAFLPKVKENESGGDIEKGDTQDQEKDYYSLLGLESNKATTEQIRRAYKKKSLEFHPDKIVQRQKKGVSFNTDDEEKMRRDFQRIKEAYEVSCSSVQEYCLVFFSLTTSVFFLLTLALA